MSGQSLLLDDLPQLGPLFKLLISGRHLNRAAEPVLWVEVEREQENYERLFQALGYDLRVDPRGFAWFHSEQGSSTTSNTTRQLALLFMVLFDYQADAGRSLLQFTDWRVDRALLADAAERHQEVLKAEGLEGDALFELLNSAERYGFARRENTAWRLLPAVGRYLDYFQELAERQADNTRDWLEEPIHGADEPERGTRSGEDGEKKDEMKGGKKNKEKDENEEGNAP